MYHHQLCSVRLLTEDLGGGVGFPTWEAGAAFVVSGAVLSCDAHRRRNHRARAANEFKTDAQGARPTV